ncbi:unnamed protein product [Dicrocoelium dendriticum]|nr:unnamed protein product [Dicrocoelium dendriticum]
MKCLMTCECCSGSPIHSVRSKRTVKYSLLAVVLCGYAVSYYVFPYASQAYRKSLISELEDNLTGVCHQMLSTRLGNAQVRLLATKNVTRMVPGFLNSSSNCRAFKWINAFQTQTSSEEWNFGLAFSIAVYKEPSQVARLLRAIYRPSNVYCIHIDAKSTATFVADMEGLATCFGSNVLIVPQSMRTRMNWGDLTTVEALLVCSQMLLLNTSIQWRYLLSVSGTEFPLRTNMELVRLLKAIHGSNLIDGVNDGPWKNRIPRKSLSFEVQWYKGYFYSALTREFVQYIHTNRNASEILQALRSEGRKVLCQDELFLPTLHYNQALRAPGGCSWTMNDTNPTRTQVIRFTKWTGKASECHSGRSVRNVCIMGINDLFTLTTAKHMFVNKFHYDFQSIAYDCLEHWLFMKVKNELESGDVAQTFNVTFYANLQCSRDHW